MLPGPYGELISTMGLLEAHYRDMQDIEFTIERGTLYLLQTRNGKRTAQAGLRVARDLVAEGVIEREEAVGRIDPRGLDQLLHPTIDPEQRTEPIVRGLNASPGAAVGAVALDADSAERRGRGGEAVILVRWETTPDDIHGVIAAQGVLTAHGGMTSHAAVVARGMGKPCVAGAESLRIDLEARTIRIGDTDVRRGRRADPRRLDGRGVRRRAAAGAAAGERGLRAGGQVGGRDPPPRCPRERRHPGGRGAGPRVRRRGHRPVPDRAHVHGRGAPAGGARDDPRAGGGRARTGAGTAGADAAGRLRGDPARDGRARGDDPAARPAAARVPARHHRADADRRAPAGRGRPGPRRGGAAARADPPAARGEPDARHPRLPRRPAVSRDLRDAGAGDRAGRRARCARPGPIRARRS